MADIFKAMDLLADAIVAYLDPYQPDSPPDYPNPGPQAGTILNTLVAVGEPIQVHLMERLENDLAQVSIFDIKGGKDIPFLARTSKPYTKYDNEHPPEGIPKTGTKYVETARYEKLVYVVVYAPTNTARNTLGDLITNLLGEAYRVIHPEDQAVTLFRRMNFIDGNDEQVDTLYNRTIIFRADVTMTEAEDATEIIHTDFSVGPIASYPPLTADRL